MEARMPAKSILKQTTPTAKSTLSDEEKAKAERDRRNLSIALYHANRIQHQKDIRAQILSNIEILLESPASATYTTEEASRLTSLAQLFQPSDLDSLIEERQIDGKCGYALCANMPRSKTMGASAAWRLKGRGAEAYCSNECLRKSLYIKSQLSEVPAWEREPGEEPQIVLHGDQIPTIVSADVERVRDRVGNGAELAMERGETAASFRPGQVMTPTVIEKQVVSRGSDVRAPVATTSYTLIEGYEPTMNFKDQYEPSDQESRAAADHVRAGTDPEAVDEVTDKDEREAWQGLFENIERR